LSVYKEGDPFEFCKDFEKDVFALTGCEKINENIAAITFAHYMEPGMWPGGITFSRHAFIKNEGNKYSAITLRYWFPKNEDEGLSNMKEKQIREIASNQLSELDVTVLKTFDKILSTFKFTK
jgi:hypothetical protein